MEIILGGKNWCIPLGYKYTKCVKSVKTQSDNRIWIRHLAHRRISFNKGDQNVCENVNPGFLTLMSQHAPPFHCVTVKIYTHGNTDLWCLHFINTLATTILCQIILIPIADKKLAVQLWVCMTVIYDWHCFVCTHTHTAQTSFSIKVCSHPCFVMSCLVLLTLL